MRINQYHNHIDQRKAALLLVILLVMLCSPVGTLTVTLIAIYAQTLSAAHTNVLLALVVCGVATSGVSLALLRAGYLRITAWIVTLLSVAILNAVYLTIGSANGGVILFFYALPILCSALIGTRKMVFASGVLSIAGVSLALAIQHIFKKYAPGTSHYDSLATLVFFAMIVTIITLITEYFSSSYQQALALSIQREHDLETLRISLAHEIAERTQELRQALHAVEVRELNIAKALSSLGESEARQRAMLEAIPDAMYRVNRDGVCLDYKPERHFATTLPDHSTLVGQRAEAVLPPELVAKMKLNADQVLATGQPQQFEYQLLVNDELRDREIRMVQCGGDEVLSIARDITERKKIDRLKNEFVSVVSHELRTPLTSIRGAIGLIAGGVAGEIPATALTMLAIAQTNSDRLLRLINDILDIERIENGRLAFNLQQLSLPKLIEQALVANQGYAAQYGIELAVVNPLPEVYIHADGDRMQQVLANLLSNAIKFSPAGQVVRIAVDELPEQVRVVIRDKGPGIPHSFRGQIFGKFAQADASDQRQKGGAGLGLSISKAIIEQFGGSIGFVSEVGQGTAFFFDLPILPPVAAIDPCEQEVHSVE